MADPRQQLLEREAALYRAQIAGDVAAIRPLLSRDLVYIHSTGVAETHEGYLAGVVDRLYEYGSIETRERRVQVFDQVAIVTGIVDMTVSAKGAAKQMIHLRFSLIWGREDGTWRLTFRQATRIP